MLSENQAAKFKFLSLATGHRELTVLKMGVQIGAGSITSRSISAGNGVDSCRAVDSKDIASTTKLSLGVIKYRNSVKPDAVAE